MRHGGDLDEASRRFGISPEGWLDLSTGINPRPYPVAGLGGLETGFARLPPPTPLADLIAAARIVYAVPYGVDLVAAPGTEILIRILPEVVTGPATLIDISCRSYGEGWGAALTLVPDSASAEGDGRASVLVVNPNNPDGRTIPARDLLRIARSRKGAAALVVDEAYADAEPGASIVPHLRPEDPVLVLRSFGKFFGLPGLRLGFAIGRTDLVEPLRARLGDWPVSGPAITVGTAALADGAWHDATRHWLGNQSQSLDSVLMLNRLTAAGGCRLFRIADVADADAIHSHLARHGIWTRIFAGRPSLVRFGLPADKAGLQRLAAALATR